MTTLTQHGGGGSLGARIFSAGSGHYIGVSGENIASSGQVRVWIPGDADERSELTSIMACVERPCL